MDRIKTKLDVINGNLYTVQNGSRRLAVKCNAQIQIKEHSVSVPMLGKGRIIDDRSIVLLITFEQTPQIHNIECIDGFQFQGDVLRRDGTCEEITFHQCMLDSDLALTESGSCTFEVACSKDLIRYLSSI